MTTGKQEEQFLFEIMESHPLDKAITFIVETFDPEDIYPKEQLEKWAEQNGYVKE